MLGTYAAFDAWELMLPHIAPILTIAVPGSGRELARP